MITTMVKSFLPQVDGYAGLAGVEGVGYFHNIVDSGETFDYRQAGGGNADQPNTDAPRLQYITSGLVDYNIAVGMTVVNGITIPGLILPAYITFICAVLTVAVVMAVLPWAL